ncbi:MAG: tRNA (adenosine(37)-N6)-threonylcarbamoyltransferase complex ATPase subunit type 1 TsaE [Rhizobiaceae bacterium]
MQADAIRLVLADETETQRLGQDIAMALRTGDVLLLKGDLGAGKSTLARAIIRTLADDPALEVPSPTFTLVQTYETRVPVRHFDLYRLSSPDELLELGLEEALQEAVVLVEWPERAEGSFPANAVAIELAHVTADGRDVLEGRIASISGIGPTFDRIRRSLAIREFLFGAGWADAQRSHLTGDASARSYETAGLPGEPTRIVMNSPRLVLGPPVRDSKPYAVIAHTAQSVAAFVGVGGALKANGVVVPAIYAKDLDNGFLLIEHLGTESFLHDGKPVAERYAAAAELLAFMHAKTWPDEMTVDGSAVHILPPFDRAAMMIEVELLVDWYVPHASGLPASDVLRQKFSRLWDDALDRISDTEKSILLRDYHSPNLIWRPELQGHDRLGVLDFQDAMRGPMAYDVASLAMDARATVSPDIEASTVAAYCDARQKSGGFDRAAFDLSYATMAAQRNSKILGIFVRLDRRDGKPQYLKLLPRIRDYLKRALAHPDLAALRGLYIAEGFIDA